MRSIKFSNSMAFAFFIISSNSALAATVAVTTAFDEDNNNTSGVNALSLGCSLREAITSYNNGAAYNDCSLTGSGAIDTISIDAGAGLAADLTHKIPVNGLTDDPTMPTGMGTVRHGPLPTIGSHGPLTIQGTGAKFYIGCGDGDSGATNGAHIFTLGNSAEVTFTNMIFQGCTAGGDGPAISAPVTTGAYLTLTDVDFKNIHSDNGSGVGGKGGAVYFYGAANLTRGGRLSMTNVTFGGTGVTPDPADGCSSGLPGFAGNGGALAIETIGNSTSDGTSGGTTVLNPVVLNGVSFDHNSAGGNGGAVWINNTTSTARGFNIQFLNNNFTNNVANGDTASSSGANSGGGAIWAQTTANDMSTTSPEVFLIQGSLTGSQFLANSAAEGNGGAILLAGGRLIYSDPAVPTAGGIVGVNFSGNTAPTGTGAGNGGAIYSRGALSVVQSSFSSIASPALGGNSGAGSGGAIALNGSASGSLITPTIIANVTFTGNIAGGNGGAIANLQSGLQAVNAIQLINDTIDSNTASGTPGGSIHNLAPTNTLLVSNTIISNGTGGNCAGNVPTNSTPTQNLQFPGSTCGGTITTGDPQLGSPSIHAGPNLLVLTMEPMTGSPALNTADTTVCAAGPVLGFDATGRSSIRSVSSCDIGAYESSNAPVTLQSFSVD